MVDIPSYRKFYGMSTFGRPFFAVAALLGQQSDASRDRQLLGEKSNEHFDIALRAREQLPSSTVVLWLRSRCRRLFHLCGNAHAHVHERASIRRVGPAIRGVCVLRSVGASAILGVRPGHEEKDGITWGGGHVCPMTRRTSGLGSRVSVGARTSAAPFGRHVPRVVGGCRVKCRVMGSRILLGGLSQVRRTKLCSCFLPLTVLSRNEKKLTSAVIAYSMSLTVSTDMSRIEHEREV